MLQVIHNVLNPEQLVQIRTELETATFKDGGSSAFGMARSVKNNLQIDLASHGNLIEQVREALLANAEFRRLTMPIRFTGMRVSRYCAGMHYGNHVDGAMIDNVRTDISFTLYLEDPSAYTGGDLVIVSAIGEVRVRLPAGSVVLYSSGAVHRVDPVESGKRDVVIGWVQSLIREDRQREVVSDLDLLLRDYLRRVGHDSFADVLLKCQQNLSRMWIDPHTK